MRSTRCTWLGRGKEAGLGTHKPLSTFPPPLRLTRKSSIQVLRRREGDETTVQRRVGKPASDNASLVTERFIRTDTRGSSSRPGERFSTKRPDTFTQTRCFAQLQTSCSPAADHTLSSIEHRVGSSRPQGGFAPVGEHKVAFVFRTKPRVTRLLTCALKSS
jgi:hypothetical protein